MKRIKILHLSDLHFPLPLQSGKVDDKEGVLGPEDYEGHCNVKVFEEYLLRLAKEVDTEKCILVTGDLTDKGKVDGLNQAASFLKSAADILGIPYGNIIVAPGNHDIQRAELSAPQWQPFKAATTDFCTPFNPTNVFEIKNHLIILPLNSCQLHIDKSPIKRFFLKDAEKITLTEIAKISEDQFLSMAETLSLSKAPIRIAALHHHIVPIWGVEAKKFDPILNAGKFVRELQKRGFSLIVHGHKHGRGVKYFQDMELTSHPVGFYVISANWFGDKIGWFNEIDITFKTATLPQIIYKGYFLEGGSVKEVKDSIDCSPKILVETEKQAIDFALEI
jgi:3',5'-cyclic AMP phosphodiesterase CpdA